MDGHTFVLAGVARKEGLEVPFRAEGDLPGESLQRVIQSIETDIAVADREERPGRLHVEVFLDEWLRFIDFASLAHEDEASQKRFPLDSSEGVALRRGIRSRFAYGARWSGEALNALGS